MSKPRLCRVVEEPGRFRSTVRVSACLGGLLLLAGCSGGGGGDAGGSGSSGGSSTVSDIVSNCQSPGTDWADCTYETGFDASKASTFRNSLEYRYADASFTNPTALKASLGSPGYGDPGSGAQSNPYNLINLDTALGAGITGAGKIVAVLDNGFRLSHQELVGQVAGSYGTIADADHGTHVASIIAGKMDGSGMLGVAPDAKLFLTDWAHGDGGGFADVQWMADATAASASAGAIAQNNSWGWVTGSPSRDITVDDVKATGGNTYYDALSAVIGDAAESWQAYVAALDSFQNSGVVVFANSNDETITSASAAAGMPAFFPQLEEAWIVAVNGYFQVDGSDNITYAQRLSAPCAEMATMCIAGDGTTYAAESYADDDYWAGTGTSYVAPQISGAVALVSEAFPSLSPPELTDRLLASADNSWFPALKIAGSGEVDFGNGVVHGYSDEWGMGTLDIAAALMPVGSLIIPLGDNLATAERTPVSSATISSSSAFGDGLEASLDGVDMAVFDGLNADFHINAGDLVQAGGDSLLDRITKASRSAPGTPTDGDDAAFDDRFAFATFGSGRRTVTTRMGFTEDVAAFTGVGTAKADLGDSSVLALTDGAVVASAERQFGRLGFNAYAFTGSHDDLDEGMLSGVGASLNFAAGTSKITFGLNQLVEQGALLGLEGSDSFDFGDGGNIGSVNVGLEQPIGERLSLFAGAELGLATATGLAGTGLVGDVDRITFSGLTIGASVTGLLSQRDRLTLSAAQPLRVESGSVAMNLPVGRDQDGNILYEAVEADLAPSGREIDISLAYDLAIREADSLKLGLYYALDAGHVADADALGLAAFYRKAF